MHVENKRYTNARLSATAKIVSQYAPICALLLLLSRLELFNITLLL